jgi:hypothetical protein
LVSSEQPSFLSRRFLESPDRNSRVAVRVLEVDSAASPHIVDFNFLDVEKIYSPIPERTTVTKDFWLLFYVSKSTRVVPHVNHVLHC